MKIRHIVFDHDGTLVNTDKRPFHVYNGLLQLLELLHAKQIKIYVWTARDRKSTLESLRSLAIMPLVEDLCTSSDAEVKPSIEGLKDMLFGVDPLEVLLVGDSGNDIIGGKAFGAYTVAAAWGHSEYSFAQYFSKFGPDSTCRTTEEFCALVEAMI